MGLNPKPYPNSFPNLGPKELKLELETDTLCPNYPQAQINLLVQ